VIVEYDAPESLTASYENKFW